MSESYELSRLSHKTGKLPKPPFSFALLSRRSFAQMSHVVVKMEKLFRTTHHKCQGAAETTRRLMFKRWHVNQAARVYFALCFRLRWRWDKCCDHVDSWRFWKGIWEETFAECFKPSGEWTFCSFNFYFLWCRHTLGVMSLYLVVEHPPIDATLQYEVVVKWRLNAFGKPMI